MNKAEKFKQKFMRELGEEYELISEYHGSHEPISALHIPCGEIRTTAASKFWTKGCPVCARMEARKRKAEKQAQENIAEIEQKYNVTSLTAYGGARAPHQWRCNVCGAEITRSIENILWRPEYGGLKCECQNVNKYRAKFLRLLKKVYAKKVQEIERAQRAAELAKEREKEWNAIKSVYEKNGYRIVFCPDNERVILKHERCGRKYSSARSSMRRHYGCRECAKKGISFGVEQIERWLDSHAIAYKREVCLPGCVYEKELPFDFVVYNANGNMVCAIEFNGEQHYKPIKYFGGYDKFIEIQRADKIKAEYCSEIDLPLYIIAHGDDVEQILAEIFVNKNNGML